MNKTWLLIDVSYLAHRAMYTTGFMQHDNQPTGILFGIFREVFALRRKFNTDYVCWCFDDRKENLWRTKRFPDYKKNRMYDPSNDLQRKKKKQLVRQVNDLRHKWLPMAESVNIGFKDTMEADDIIAMYRKGSHYEMKGENDCVMVSADQDLYQLLRNKTGFKTIMYNPSTKQTITSKSFQKEHGILPGDWPTVKAIAGCTSDCIPGLKGIGPVTAIKYLQWNGNIKPDKFKAIDKAYQEWREFLHLTTLEDVAYLVPEAKKDKEQSSDQWGEVFRKLGFTSLRK